MVIWKNADPARTEWTGGIPWEIRAPPRRRVFFMSWGLSGASVPYRKACAHSPRICWACSRQEVQAS